MKTRRCRWYVECPYPVLRDLARRVKKLALDAGPIGVKSRDWSVEQSAEIRFDAQALPGQTDGVEFRALIEDVGSITADDPDLIVDYFKRKLGDKK